MSYTPRPWHRYTNTIWDDDGYIHGPLGQHVAYVRNDPRDDAVVDGQREANLQLISSAPDLLEALKWIRSHLPDDMGTTEWDKRLRQADEALTKAGVCLDCEYNPGLCDTHDEDLTDTPGH